jgi:hypothetical protein
MSGLPDIGDLNAQVGYSRLAWRASKDDRLAALSSFEARPCGLAPQDDAPGILSPAARQRMMTARIEHLSFED